jgi:hypothetical protein
VVARKHRNITLGVHGFSCFVFLPRLRRTLLWLSRLDPQRPLASGLHCTEMPLSLWVLSNFPVVESAVTQSARKVFVGTAERWVDNDVTEFIFMLRGRIKLVIYMLNDKTFFMFNIKIYNLVFLVTAKWNVKLQCQIKEFRKQWCIALFLSVFFFFCLEDVYSCNCYVR